MRSHLRLAGRAHRDIVLHGESLGPGSRPMSRPSGPSRALILEAPYTAALDVAAEAYPWVPGQLAHARSVF
jgi:hypothetical protein